MMTDAQPAAIDFDDFVNGDNNEMVLQSVQEGKELQKQQHQQQQHGGERQRASKSKTKKEKKKKKSSSKKSKSKRSERSESSPAPLITGDDNTATLTSLLMQQQSDDWPVEQEDAWKTESRQSSVRWPDLASVGGVSTWTEDQGPQRKPGTPSVGSAGTNQSKAEESLDPELVFHQIDRRERHAHKSMSNGLQQEPEIASRRASRDQQQMAAATASFNNAAAAAAQPDDPSGMHFAAAANFKQAPANNNTNNFMVEVPAEKWEAFDDNLISTASTNQAPAKQQQDYQQQGYRQQEYQQQEYQQQEYQPTSTFTEVPDDKWDDDISDMGSQGASFRQISSKYLVASPVATPVAMMQAPSPQAPAGGPQMMGDSLISYLLSMGYDRDKAAKVAASFVAQQHQAPAAAPARESASSAAMASKLRELEQPAATSRSHTLQVAPSTRQLSGNASAAAAAPPRASASSAAMANKLRELEQPAANSRSHTLQVAPSTRRLPADDTDNRGSRRPPGGAPGPRPSNRPAGRQPAPGAAGPPARGGAARQPGRRPRPPVPMYERFDRPGAVEMEGRAFGAPRRRSEELPKPPLEEDSPTAPDLSEGFVIEATTVDAFVGTNSSDIVTAVAKPLSLKSALKETPIRRIAMCGLLIVAVAVAGTVSYFMLRSDSNEGSSGGDSFAELQKITPSPSSAPTFINDEILQSAAEISGWDVLADTTSAQLQAVSWLSAFDEANEDNYGPSFLQRYTMAVFYYSTNGNDWINGESWLDPSLHECDWSEGISCLSDSTNRRIITGIDAPRNGLSGSIPPEIGNLQAIDYLRLGKNNISGSIPDGICKLKRMGSLDLSANKISGSLPMNMGDASDIVVLDLHKNNINGSIPDSIYSMTLLRSIDLSWNQLTGPVVDKVANLKVLATLDLRHNKLSGTLTSAFTELPALDFFLLDHNEISGKSLGLSSNMGYMLEISLSHNKLTGSIPAPEPGGGLGILDFRIQKVDMSYNQLTGTLSGNVAFLPTLRHVDLSGNNFTGVFPGEWGWSGIQYIAAGNNQFSGTLPLGYPATLAHLDFGGNAMIGGLSEDLCSFPNLNFLDLSSNVQLGGTIPTCLSESISLRNLNLANSNLEGTLSPAFGQMLELDSFNVSSNVLSNTIPSELTNCVDLKMLDLSHNDFVGTIPSELGELRFLTTLHLDNNALTGTVPESFGELTKLEELTLIGNPAGGTIPWQLCDTANLTIPYIGCNFICSCCLSC